MSLRVACIQFDISFGNPEINIETVKTKIKQTVKQYKPDVIVLPEMWNTGYDLKRLEEIADLNGIQTINVIGELAKRYNCNIVAGSVAKKTADGITNTMFAFNRNGKVVGEYSKLHLFKLMNEEKYLLPGNKKGLFTLDDIPSAGLICYDIRFPEWVMTHSINGAKVIYVAAEWPLARVDHWRTLLISRAIESQSYIVACNRAGSDPANEFAGHSVIIDPWGKIISEADINEQIVFGILDLNIVDDVRKKIPVYEDRRPKFYK